MGARGLEPPSRLRTAFTAQRASQLPNTPFGATIPPVGFEPTTKWLRAIHSSQTELRRREVFYDNV